jgi:prevent-host-death family protein
MRDYARSSRSPPLRSPRRSSQRLRAPASRLARTGSARFPPQRAAGISAAHRGAQSTRVATCGHVTERIGIRQLRDHLTATIRRVRDGETLEITHDGVPVALLSPISADRLERLERAGELTRAVPLTRPIRRFEPLSGRSTEDIIGEDRDR